MESDAVRDLLEELNRPSAARLKTALRARGIAYDPKVVDAVVSRSTEKQQQAPAYRYSGKIVSTDVNARWAIDTINLTSRPSKGQRYIVVCQDIFTRRVFAKASPSVSPAAVGQIFESFVAQHGVPKELNTDSGAEYTSPAFKQILERLNIAHRVKDPQSKNDLATVDRAIQTLKKAMLIGPGDWSERLPAVVRGMNKSPHAALADVAPDAVEDKPDLVFHLRQGASQGMVENAQAIDKRGEALQKMGAFRAEIPPKGFRRAHHAKFSGEVHQVADVGRDKVTDTQGREFQTKIHEASASR